MLQFGEVVSHLCTVGFMVQDIPFNDHVYTIWEVGGQDKIRRIWPEFYKDSDAVIYVVDSSCRERIVEAREELFKALRDERLEKAKLLVYLTRKDMPNAMEPGELTEKLGLYEIKSREWYVQPCCSTNGEGLKEGLEWLHKSLKKSEGKETKN